MRRTLPRLRAAAGLLTCTILFLAGAPQALPAAEAQPSLFVSPQGNDAWSGRLAEPNAGKTDGPLATLDVARQAVARLRQQEPARGAPVVVAVRGGTYFLAQPLAFGPADSGTEKSPTIYQAYGDERPMLSGGVKLDGWQVTPDGRWHKTLAEVKDGKWSFAQLFANDQRRLRPRLPKQGYYKIAAPLPQGPKGAKPSGEVGFFFADDNLRADWANRGDVEVLTMHEWNASRMRIATLDADQHKVLFTGGPEKVSSWNSFKKNYRYLLENVREALDTPGQWYLDRPSGELTYLPMPGELPERTTVIAPRLEQVVLLQGDLKAGRWVEHLRFRGLTFAHSNWTLPATGQSIPQAEVILKAAIAGVAARNIAFDACAVRHTGGHAMGFGPGCRGNSVENCELVDLGAGGIMIGHVAGTWSPNPGNVPDDDPAVVSHHTIRRCLIAHGGRLHPAAVGVWIGHSPYNVVERNDIYDFFYTGISAGWIWGYAPSKAHHNDIGFNHVHTLGQNVLSDMGGIYTLGISPGTVIHDNCFHDIQAFSYGGWGMYTDEGSTGIVMENNLVYRTKTGSFHQHYGKENRIQNNILVRSTQHQVQRTRMEKHISFFFERNIVFWDNGSPLLASNWKDDNYKIDYNLYWPGPGATIKMPGGLSFDEWQQKRKNDEHSIVADPLFVDPEKDDYRLKEGSPAAKIGFKPFDLSQAGRGGPAVLTRDLPPVPKTFE